MNQIIDKLSSIIKLNSGSSIWKSKASSEKTKIDNLITQNYKMEDGVVKVQTQKFPIIKLRFPEPLKR